jgi:hypothetical protein
MPVLFDAARFVALAAKPAPPSIFVQEYATECAFALFHFTLKDFPVTSGSGLRVTVNSGGGAVTATLPVALLMPSS